jgi:hypothetical protein
MYFIIGSETSSDQKRLKVGNFGMKDEDRAVLEKHFGEMRIPVGTVIRMVLSEYAKGEGKA